VIAGGWKIIQMIKILRHFVVEALLASDEFEIALPVLDRT
jgi:hypothetical protein